MKNQSLTVDHGESKTHSHASETYGCFTRAGKWQRHNADNDEQARLMAPIEKVATMQGSLIP